MATFLRNEPNFPLRLNRRLDPTWSSAGVEFIDETGGGPDKIDAQTFEGRIMDISPIKSQRDYRKVLKEIEGLMSAKRNTPEGDRLDVLVTLVEAWEWKHYPMDLPDPVEAIKYHMDQNGLQPRDLIPFIGSRNRMHEVLNRRRSLTLKMIWRLHAGLGIPAESLIRQPEAKGLQPRPKSGDVGLIDENGGGPSVRLRKLPKQKR